MNFIKSKFAFLLGRSDEANEVEEELITEYAESFKAFVRRERPYKVMSSIAFFILVFGFGIPMWYWTTSTYRASFPVFDANRTILVPVRILIATTDSTIKPDILDLIVALEANLTQKDTVAPLEFEWNIEYVGVKSFQEMEQDRSLKVEENDRFFDVHVAIVAKKDWDHYSATNVRLGIGKWNFIQWVDKKSEDTAKPSGRVTDLIWEILIDVPHLNSIVRRDLRQKMMPWQIAALPLSHQKRLVWDSAPLAMQYYIQIIHLHDNEGPKEDELKTQGKTSEALRRFGKMVKDVTKVEVTSEHLWDFDVTNSFLVKDVQERWTLTHSAMEDLIKKVDMQMQTSLKVGTPMRFVILETKEPVVILDQQGEDISGAAVAAWGAVLVRNDQTEARAIAAIRIQLGMDAELMVGWWRPPVALCQWEIGRARLRASVDNAMRAASAVKALDEMTKKISNIVINDEVAAMATKAVQLLEEAMTKGKMLNYQKLLEARKLADSANSDHSLLAKLYFPMDQRTAVLVPLAVPVALPIIKLTYQLVRKFIFREYI